MNNHGKISWWIAKIQNKTSSWLSKEQEQEPLDPMASATPATCVEGSWSCPENMMPESKCLSPGGCRYPRPHHNICKEGAWVHGCSGAFVPLIAGFILLVIISICALFYRIVRRRTCSRPNTYSHLGKQSAKLSTEFEEKVQGKTDKEKLLVV